jgi:pimeloyl-ACP methyl ester carboxylesterase
MPRVVLNEVETYYKQAGEGPDLVLIHGLAANHAFWKFDLLVPLARGYRVTVYDLRGHGLSAMPDAGYDSAQMARDLGALLDHAGIECAHLAGHSQGAVVGLHYATLCPARVRSLTLVDARVRAVHPIQRLEDWPDGAWAAGVLEQFGLSAPADEPDIGLWLLDQMSAPGSAALRERMRDGEWWVPFGGWNNGTRAAARWQKLLHSTTLRADVARLAGLTEECLRRLDLPVLLVYGSQSRCLQSYDGLRAALPDCRGVLVDGAGHFFPASRPEALVEPLRAFLAEAHHARLGA